MSIDDSLTSGSSFSKESQKPAEARCGTGKLWGGLKKEKLKITQVSSFTFWKDEKNH